MVTVENYAERQFEFYRPAAEADKDKGLDVRKRLIMIPRAGIVNENGQSVNKPGQVDVSEEVLAEMKADRVAASWFVPGGLNVRTAAFAPSIQAEGKRKQ